MTVRIHGPGIAGKTVHIQASKCTIGSAECCTLRLCSAGVESASCWILRGPSGAVIRRLRGPALLNGQAFDEALLEPGDRLQIGSVDLVLVKLLSDPPARQTLPRQAAATAEPAPASAPSAIDNGRLVEAERLAASRASELEAARFELGALREQVAEKQAAEASLRTAATAERHAWSEERVSLETQLSQLAAELRSLRAAAVSDSTMTVPLNGGSLAAGGTPSRWLELEEQAQELRQQNVELQQKLNERAELEERCQQLSQDLESQCRAYAELQERESTALGRAHSQEDLDERSAGLARWQDELTERGERLTAAEGRIQDQQQLVESQRGELETDRRRQAAEQNELTADRQRLLAERESLTAEQIAFAANQAAQADAGRAAETLQAREEQIVRQTAELTQRDNSLAAEAESLKERSAELETLRQRLEAEQAALAERSQRLTEAESATAAPPEEPASAAAPRADEQHAALASPEAESPEQRDSNSVDSVLSRLVQAGLWRQDVSDDASAAARSALPPSATMPVASMPSATMPVASMQFESRPHAPHASSASDDEESIESYMERLMQRVRGDSPSSPAQRFQPSAPPVAEKPTAPQPLPCIPAPIPAQADPAEPGEYVPRSMAPEMGSGLSAMRELANSASRTAIDLHIRQHTFRLATGKLFGACFCLMTGGFLGYYAWRQPSRLTLAGAALSFLLATLWFATGLRHYSRARQLDRAAEPKAVPGE